MWAEKCAHTSAKSPCVGLVADQTRLSLSLLNSVLSLANRPSVRLWAWPDGWNNCDDKAELGLAGAAEVKVGEKRLIEILFGPVSKFLEAKEF